jgi:predicted tellurium resistance membrane protein TerC
MRTQPTAITELPPSPEDERRTRMIRYTIAMSIRMVCLLLVVILPDLWKIAPGIGAIVLPYIAVIIANNTSSGTRRRVARPGALVRASREKDAA